jgi:hypothetical protein
MITPTAAPAPMPSPAQLPRTVLPATPTTIPPVDACINFNLPDGRVVCMSVPPKLAQEDVPFVLAVLQGYLTALARPRL